MVDINQFGSAQPGSAQTCGRCEALLMDVLDGAATPEDQQFFDAHVASCTGCSHMLADARRGGAWLEMLRDPRPEPPAALFERILAQTSGLSVAAPTPIVTTESAALHPLPVSAPIHHIPAPGIGSNAKILPFRIREAVHRVSHTLLQPRLAMTAAMAFFSIALTLNLTGVHVGELRVGDLRPSNLRKSFYAANAHVVRYCDNLRVVYELEARTHDLQQSADSNDQSPATGSEAQPRGSEPDKPADPNQQQKRTVKPGPGTSQREALPNEGHLVADDRPQFSKTHSKGDLT